MTDEPLEYDIAIVGLGPAGATLARLLDSRFRVIAIDKKSADATQSFRKPCGGLLSPDAQRVLSKLNLTLPKNILVDPQIFTVKTIDSEQNLLRYYQRFYLNLDRHQFDLWLTSLIPSHIQIAANATLRNICAADGGYQLTYRQDGAQYTVHAKYVVGADGANSVVRNTLLPKRKIHQYVSIQQWFHETHSIPFYSCILDAKLTDSYAWSVSKEGHFIFGGAFPKSNCRARFEQMKDKLKKFGFIFGEPIQTEACLISQPRKRKDFCVGSQNAFFIGEAAGFISPSSHEGISYALESALYLAQTFNSDCNQLLKQYRRATSKIRRKLLRKNYKRFFIYHRLSRKLIMKSGLQSIRIIDIETCGKNGDTKQSR